MSKRHQITEMSLQVIAASVSIEPLGKFHSSTTARNKMPPLDLYFHQRDATLPNRPLISSFIRLVHRSRSRSRSRSRDYRTRSRSAYSRSPKRSNKSPKRSRSPRRGESRDVSKSPRNLRDLSRSKSKTVDRSKSRSVGNRSPSRDSRSHSRNGDD